MIKRGDSRGLSTIIATLLIIVLTLVAVGVIWVVVRGVIQSGAEQVSLGKFTLNLEIKDVVIDPANPSNIIVSVKRNVGEGEISGLKFIIDDGENTEVVEVNNFSLKELEERKINLSLSYTNASHLQTVSVAPIFKLESGKEVTGDVKDKYEIPKSSGTSGTTCIPNCAGRNCGSDGCTGICGPCPTGTCNLATGQCVTTCTPGTCLGKSCGSWANGTCAGTLNCGTCTTGTCNLTTGQCVTTQVWTGELMINGGFETGTFTGWTTSGAYWGAGTSGWSGNASPANGTSGAYTSSANTDWANGFIYQDVNLTAYASYIDAGNAVVNATGWGISSEIPPQDWTRVQIMYLFSNRTIIKTAADSGNKGIQPWWRTGVLNDIPPVGTRYVRVWGNTYESGVNNAGILDSFSVMLGYLS